MAKTKKVPLSKPVNKEFKFDFAGLESQIETLITKNLPKLPQNIVDILVKFAPWMAILSVIFGLQGVYAIFMVNRWADQLYAMTGVRNSFIVQLGGIFLLAQVVLSALSIQGLFAKKLSAWRLMYFATWLGIVENLINFNLVSLIISAAISFYILFQVKKEYR